jgi:hypothetical protein
MNTRPVMQLSASYASSFCSRRPAQFGSSGSRSGPSGTNRAVGGVKPLVSPATPGACLWLSASRSLLWVRLPGPEHAAIDHLARRCSCMLVASKMAARPRGRGCFVFSDL